MEFIFSSFWHFLGTIILIAVIGDALVEIIKEIKWKKLAQAISDVSWSTFVTMLEYKADWYGKNILKIGRFEPSSKLHANCGYINKDLTLSDREWTCPKCGELVSRDINAAINIKSFALKNILSGTDRKNQGKLPTLVGALTLEAQPIASGVGG